VGRGINFASFNGFDIEFWKCSDSVVFFDFHYNVIYQFNNNANNNADGDSMNSVVTILSSTYVITWLSSIKGICA
jgi:hypothetical protein